MLYCATTTLTSYVQNKIPLKLFIVIRKWWVLNATIVLMITLQNSRATCSKWRNAVSSGILSFCFFGQQRYIENPVKQCFAVFSMRLCSISDVAVEYLPTSHWVLFKNNFEYLHMPKLLFFVFFRKDNFTFKCHRSDVSGSGQTQDVYAVKVLLNYMLRICWSQKINCL